MYTVVLNWILNNSGLELRVQVVLELGSLVALLDRLKIIRMFDNLVIIMKIFYAYISFEEAIKCTCCYEFFPSLQGCSLPHYCNYFIILLGDIILYFRKNIHFFRIQLSTCIAYYSF